MATKKKKVSKKVGKKTGSYKAAKPLSKLEALKRDLIASIQNEKRTFNMGFFTKGGSYFTDYASSTGDYVAKPASCGTASCIAGHIEAIRPKVVKKLIKENGPYYEHEDLASAVWEAETGQECRLDFFGQSYQGPARLNEEYGCYVELEDITREEAIAHIRGRSKRWPLLTKSEAK